MGNIIAAVGVTGVYAHMLTVWCCKGVLQRRSLPVRIFLPAQVLLVFCRAGKRVRCAGYSFGPGPIRNFISCFQQKGFKGNYPCCPPRLWPPAPHWGDLVLFVSFFINPRYGRCNYKAIREIWADIDIQGLVKWRQSMWRLDDEP